MAEMTSRPPLIGLSLVLATLAVALVSVVGSQELARGDAAAGADGQSRRAPSDKAVKNRFSVLRRAKPGPEAAAANELFKGGKLMEACEAFFAQLAAGTRDPWAYRGAALCASEQEVFTARLTAALEGDGSGLAAFARGYLALRRSHHTEAEGSLRRAVELEPELALAWEALAATLRAQGESEEANRHLERAVELAPGLAKASQQLQRARLGPEIFDRLLNLLGEIPARWSALGQPRVPVSGRSPDEVLAAASEEQLGQALTIITWLIKAPGEQRSELIARLVEEIEPTEVDLWVPGLLAQEQQFESVEEAAVTVEAWLRWAEALGRRDALLFAAAFAVDLAIFRVNPELIVPLAKRWAALPTTETTQGSHANVHRSLGSLLFRLGDNEGALVPVAAWPFPAIWWTGSPLRPARGWRTIPPAMIGDGRTWPACCCGWFLPPASVACSPGVPAGPPGWAACCPPCSCCCCCSCSAACRWPMPTPPGASNTLGSPR